MITVSITGFDKLVQRAKGADVLIEREIRKALGDSIAMAETESKRRTPVDTGLLRSSIGGSRGFRSIRSFFAEVGTNVEYAIHVHEGHGRHVVGERKYMEKGAKAATPYIRKRLQEALENVTRQITR